MNIKVQVPDQVLISFPLGIYPEEEMLDHITVLFNLLRNIYTMFHNGCSKKDFQKTLYLYLSILSWYKLN